MMYRSESVNRAVTQKVWDDQMMFNSNVSIPKEHIESFDTILNRIGFGRYQLWIYLIMGLNGITEGS
jgi:hypothetical protein